MGAQRRVETGPANRKGGREGRPIVTSESVVFCQALSMLLTDGNRQGVVFSEHRLPLPLRARPH